MDIGILGLIIAFTSFAGSAVGAALGNLLADRLAYKERIEARHRARQEFLTDAAHQLIQLRGELQFLSGVLDGEPLHRERELTYGKAFAIMLSIYNSDTVGNQAWYQKTEKIMFSNNAHDKLTAINDGIKYLGKRVAEFTEFDKGT
jgi:hypothetical protein